MCVQTQRFNAAVEGLRVKQCGMLLAYTTCRHPAVTPGHTRQALLKVPPPPLRPPLSSQLLSPHDRLVVHATTVLPILMTLASDHYVGT